VHKRVSAVKHLRLHRTNCSLSGVVVHFRASVRGAHGNSVIVTMQNERQSERQSGISCSATSNQNNIEYLKVKYMNKKEFYTQLKII
jgi:hypothetical protein